MLVPAVKERILKAEGWIPRPTCPPEDQARDWEEIQDGMRERGRDLSEFTVAHENFMHFVDTNDPGTGAPRAARGVPEGDERDARPGLPGVGLPVRHARRRSSRQLQARVDAGIDYLMLHTMTPDIAQLDLWVRDIVPNVKFPVSAPARRLRRDDAFDLPFRRSSMSTSGKPFPPPRGRSRARPEERGSPMTIDLDGLIPATVLPMTDGGVIDESALRRYIRWVAKQGPVALAINVDTGEGPHLTHAEKVRVLQIVGDETDLPLVAGVAGPFQTQAVAQARDYREAGASALLVFPIPAYLSAPLDPGSPSSTTGRSPTSGCR